MNAPFEDIRITGLDAEATQRSPTPPALRLMHQSLSSSPPREWRQIFAGERQLPRHSMWRRAEIHEEHIVVDCVPEELEQYHLEDKKKMFAILMRNAENVSNTRSSTGEKLNMLQTESVNG